MTARPPLNSVASRSHWDAVVIGSGVGGCVAAALLASAGRRVLVLEKNPVVGGILASYRRDGFKIDLGSHLIARGAKGPLGAVLTRLGLDRPRFLTHPTPVRSRGLFSATAPARRRGLPWAGLRAARDLGLAPREVARMVRLLWRILTLPEPELVILDRRPLHDFLLAHTDEPRLYYLFAFLASIFFVLPPWRVSAGEAVRALRSVLRDYSLSYVEGGMDALPHALLGRVVELGGEILIETRATAIRTERQGPLEVETENGDVVVAPVVLADLGPQDLLGLLDEKKLPARWVERVRAIEPSGAAHQIKLALDRPLLDEGCVIGGVSVSGLALADLDLDLLRRTVERIDAGALVDPLPFYGPIPTNFDPSLAPAGCQLVTVSAYGPTTETPQDPPERWREHALAALRTIVPRLDQHLIFCDFQPIPAIGHWMGKSSRAAISNGQTPGQVGPDRLPSATPLGGLYIVGDGAGGRGIGTELAATSAMEAVAAINSGAIASGDAA